MDLERMKQILKKTVRKVFFLPPVPTLLISVPSYLLVIYALAGENVEPVIQYAAYFLSAYALVITATGITGAVRFARQGIDKHPLVRKLLGIPFVSKYLKEAAFRTEASLYQGFFINLLYAGIKLFSGILYSSAWFVTLAVYYILLALMRASLLHYVRKSYTFRDRYCKNGWQYPRRGKDETSRGSEWRRYRLCGIILLFMNVALAGIVILMVYENSGFAYPGVLIYVMALYAFYATITAVRNVVKFRKYGSPVMSAAKVVSLTAALVSMLSLETAMLTQFGAADDPMFRRIMTASTGAAISLIVLGMAVFMIVRSCREIKHIS